MMEIFCYPIGPIRWGTNSMGVLKETSKANLTHELEKNAEPSKEVL